MDDALKLEANGTVTFTISDQTWRLRRPKLGEFRKLRERIYELDDMRNANLEDTLAAAAADESGAGIVDRSLASRRINEQVEEGYLTWLSEAITMMSDRPLDIAADELPIWFLDGSAIREILSHWRDVPLASGDRS